MPSDSNDTDDRLDRNEVHLCGRLAAAPEERSLPSGDVLLAFRLVARRQPARAARSASVRSPLVDTLDCVARTAAARRALLRCAAGDMVEVAGELHRRFWRGSGGLASRYEIEAEKVRRARRA